MRPSEDIENIVKNMSFAAGPEMDQRLRTEVAKEQDLFKKARPAPGRHWERNAIMNSPITKLAIAAAVIAAVVLGLFEFIDTGSTSSVVWADVARKVEANRGYVFHLRWRVAGPNRPDQIAYTVVYDTGSRWRQDISLLPEGQVIKSHYLDFDAKTETTVDHREKRYLHVPISEMSLQSRESGWLNPKDWVRQFVASKYKYTKLGPQTIEGVQCEGLETTDPTFGDSRPPATKSVSRLWVSMETAYPIRLEHDSTSDSSRGDLHFEFLCERFQWDVELDESLFEPDIPANYIDGSP